MKRYLHCLPFRHIPGSLLFTIPALDTEDPVLGSLLLTPRHGADGQRGRGSQSRRTQCMHQGLAESMYALLVCTSHDSLFDEVAKPHLTSRGYSADSQSSKESVCVYPIPEHPTPDRIGVKHAIKVKRPCMYVCIYA